MVAAEDCGRRRRDKTGLVTAAVMFATEDHLTTFRKGGVERLNQSMPRSKGSQYGKNAERARVAGHNSFSA